MYIQIIMCVNMVTLVCMQGLGLLLGGSDMSIWRLVVWIGIMWLRQANIVQ